MYTVIIIGYTNLKLNKLLVNNEYKCIKGSIHTETTKIAKG